MAINQWQQYWELDPQITFLNHGSHGACPLMVLAVQQQLRTQLEQEPVRFFMREFEGLMDEARSHLCQFIHADPSDVVFVPNATTGVNTVLSSLAAAGNLDQDSELLTTDHEYNACRNALEYLADRTGSKIVLAKIPFPVTDPQEINQAIIAAITPKTKLVLIDHVTSQTALIMPIAELIAHLNQLGIPSLIDGAHAPGMVDVNLRELGATYYTGNCHKWMCTPKGAAFLYVQQDYQSSIRPLVISHGANSPRTDKSRFRLEFDWMGTSDPSAYLCIPAAIDFLEQLYGWSQIRQDNRSQTLAARKIIAEALGVELPCPDSMIGSMAVIPLPDKFPTLAPGQLIPPVQEQLFQEYAIEVPVIPWQGNPQQLLRISAQLYNTPENYQYLATALQNFNK
jgi:isopenicillin-N epimerase